MMPLLKRLLLLTFLWAIAGFCSLSAQSQLERISISERSDGNGYVIRYHLTEMVDSYDLIQPEINRIQMQLFSLNLDTEDVIMPELNDEITGVELLSIEGGIGVDITTAENIYFTTDAYPDQNLRDLLLTLEYSNQAAVRELAEVSELYDWAKPEETAVDADAESEEADDPQEEVAQEEPQQTVQRPQRNQPIVHFGFAGGVGIANKIGGSYSSDPRKGMTMGITASFDLPYILLNSVQTGIETGVFYTQKGFRNPASDKITAQTVVLDYIEFPILGRFSYDLTDMIKPKVVGGVYAAFRTAGETIREDGERSNLSDVTSSFDWGLALGFGSDFVVEKATVSLQLRYGIGIPRMFDETYSGGERPGYLSLLLGFQF